MKRIIIFLWIVVMFFLSFILWATPSTVLPGDCWLKSDYKSQGELLKEINFKDMKYIDEEIVSQAYLNLKNYCECILDNKGCIYSQWPMTPYFFEHLIDVSFRKLDGKPELSYLNVDSDAIRWRKILDKMILEDIWNTSPQKLYEEFKKYWNFEDPYKGILSKKYMYVCSDIKKIYSNLSTSSEWKLTEWSDLAWSICEIARRDRFQKELNLVKSFMIYKWTEMLEYNFRYFLIERFLKNNFNQLFEKYTQMLWFFRIVVQKVVGTKKGCNE